MTVPHPIFSDDANQHLCIFCHGLCKTFVRLLCFPLTWEKLPNPGDVGVLLSS